jgi:hypothetical protein
MKERIITISEIKTLCIKNSIENNSEPNLTPEELDRREALEWERWKARWSQIECPKEPMLLGVSDEEVLDEADDILGEELVKLNRYSKNCYTPTEIGKPFGLEGSDLNSFLADQGIIRRASGQWILTPKYRNRGLTANRYRYVHGLDGRRKLKSRLVWTEKGRGFILDLIKS